MMNKNLICVDSDGCAMNTMTIKHVKCFGPCAVDLWNLQQWQDELLKRWNDINLYTRTRGINRFPGLAMFLTEVDAKFKPIPGVAELKAWTNSTTVYSEKSLLEAIDAHPESEALRKALQWSRNVNISITLLSDEEKIAFPGVREALAKVKEHADVAIVSSANREAMEEEWERCELMQYVDYSMAQDVGTKETCIRKMIEKGYSPDHILMVGDAPGDLEATLALGVRFYPILAAHEEGSWRKFRNIVIDEFLSGQYYNHRETEEIDLFNKNLSE